MLRTSREQGCGLSQVTRVYGRFDNLALYRARYPAQLGGWAWETCADVKKQAAFYALFQSEIQRALPPMANEREARALGVAMYNRGQGGALADRRLCASTKGCDPSIWFGHIEHTCGASKAPLPGFNVSACDISRRYVARVMDASQMGKYAGLSAPQKVVIKNEIVEHSSGVALAPQPIAHPVGGNGVGFDFWRFAALYFGIRKA